MHIGISTLHIAPGKSGSHEPYLVNLVDALAKSHPDHTTTLFVTPQNRHLFFVDSERFKYKEYSSVVRITFVRIFYEQLLLPLDALRRGIDILHYPGSAGSVFMRRSDVVTVHHDSVTQRQSMSAVRNLYYDTVLSINRRAGLIITPTDAYSDELIDYFGYKSEQMRPVHHGVNPLFRNISKHDVDQARQKWGIASNAIVTITNTLPHKNIRNLLQAFWLLVNQYNSDAQLVMVGNVDRFILSNLISEITPDIHRLNDRIRVISFLPHEQLPPIYATAFVFTFVSKVETFGMPLVEAMACGLPIVASDIPVHREVLNGAALMVSPDDPKEIANALHKVLTDHLTRERLKSVSRTRSQDFSWKKTAINTLRVYEEAGRLQKNGQETM